MNTLLREKTLPGGQTLQIVQGDITTEGWTPSFNRATAPAAWRGWPGPSSLHGGPAIQEQS